MRLPLRILSGARRGKRAAVSAGTNDGARGFTAMPLRASLTFIAVGLALLAWPGASPRAAEDAKGAMAAVPKPIDLDGLFEKLKNAPDAASAAFTSHAIEQRWARSGSDTADLLMERANAALAAGDRALSIEILDRIIYLDPDWAEGWNRRATVFFLEEDYARSVADIEEVLRREPRHFGALMGLAAILEHIGNERKALSAYERVLAIYPTLPAAQKAAERLKAHLGESAI